MFTSSPSQCQWNTASINQLTPVQQVQSSHIPISEYSFKIQTTQIYLIPSWASSIDPCWSNHRTSSVSSIINGRMYNSMWWILGLPSIEILDSILNYIIPCCFSVSSLTFSRSYYNKYYVKLLITILDDVLIVAFFQCLIFLGTFWSVLQSTSSLRSSDPLHHSFSSMQSTHP